MEIKKSQMAFMVWCVISLFTPYVFLLLFILDGFTKSSFIHNVSYILGFLSSLGFGLILILADLCWKSVKKDKTIDKEKRADAAIEDLTGIPIGTIGGWETGRVRSLDSGNGGRSTYEYKINNYCTLFDISREELDTYLNQAYLLKNNKL